MMSCGCCGVARGWKRFFLQRKEEAMELALRMDMARMHFERKSQRTALMKWLDWVKSHQRRRAAVIDRLQTLVNTFRLKRILAAWLAVAKDSKRTKEYFKRLELSLREFNSKDRQTPRPTGERVDGVSVLPHHLSLKIFQYLEIRDWLNCAEVCCTWKSIVHSGALWSQINFSAGKDWITDSTVQQILRSYRPFVTRLNLRGCTSLKWSSLKYISECRNLQELNMSECLMVSDMIQRITEGCPCLLYLNLSSTPLTDHSLKAIFRNCLSLQYLSLARCRRFTDEGFLWLTTEKGGRNLTHLNLSECSQMTANGFRYISAGCPSLTEVVINDMPTLSDSCVLALLSSCYRLSSVSLLGCPHLSDVALKAIAKASNLTFFSIEGNNQITDVSWQALCSHSEGLRRLQAADCTGMTDDSLRYVASLRNLKYLDISLCSRVSDAGIKCLTDGSSTNELHHLSISRCCLVTDNSVRRIARRLRKLYHLNLSYCERLTDPAVELLSGSSICSLDLSSCNIQDKGLAALHRIHLKKIVLAECVNITDTGMEKLCKNMRDLEHVDVSHCVALSDAAIRAVSFYCRGLLTLKMSGCPKMTDMAVLYLTSGSQYLRELDMSGCPLLTDRSLRHLKRICPPLTSIRMTCCSSISWAAAMKLQTSVSHWEYSNFNPSSCANNESKGCYYMEGGGEVLCSDINDGPLG